MRTIPIAQKKARHMVFGRIKIRTPKSSYDKSKFDTRRVAKCLFGISGFPSGIRVVFYKDFPKLGASF